jgi:hypothetical protein
MSTRAIIALVKIIKNADLAPKQRIEACEMLLEYEAPLEVVEFAKKFLSSVYERDEPYRSYRSVGVDDKLRALKLTRKFEAARIKPRVVEQAEPKAAPFDPTYLIERQAMGYARLEAERQQRECGTVESIDEIRARLKLTPARSP